VAACARNGSGLIGLFADEARMKIVLRRILVPTDFSDTSRVALTYGVALAEQFGASLHLLHVIETIVAGETLPWQTGPREEVERAIESSAWDELRGLLPSDDQNRLRAELALSWGTPFVEIVRYARAHEVDLIAIGTHGRSGVEHLLMGSVAENVVRRAPCPVLSVRHPEHEFVLP
jgi:nucleotide-binding universal stress UspA family protein